MIAGEQLSVVVQTIDSQPHSRSDGLFHLILPLLVVFLALVSTWKPVAQVEEAIEALKGNIAPLTCCSDCVGKVISDRHLAARLIMRRPGQSCRDQVDSL